MSGPDPAVAATRSAVRRAVADLPPAATVLVACSGGPDSLALAAALAFVAPRLPAPVTAGAVIVDHGWHEDSADVAARAGEVCAGLGLDPVVVTRVPAGRGGSGGGGPEAAARAARYEALADVARRHAAVAVLLGHTLDDQAETVLLGLARGSGGRSLAGMARRRGLLRRPLLDLPRTTTTQACAALGLQPWQDPANRDPAYARARIRAAMQTLDGALGPGLSEALARTADLLREDADALDALAAALLERATVSDGASPGSGVALDLAVLEPAPDALRRRALLLALRGAGSPAGALGRRHVLAVDALVVAWRGQGPAHLPGRVVGRRECGRLLLVPDEPVH